MRPFGREPFAGRAAIVTGGASGIGRALGEELARRGADAVLADVDGALADEAALAVRRSGGKAAGPTGRWRPATRR